MKVITLCGSARFKKKWIEVAKILIESGYFVRSIEIFSQVDNIKLTSEFRNFLEQVHFKKIDQSDAIFVINPNGYIGESTSKEIKYAKSKKKQIFFLESHNKNYFIPEVIFALATKGKLHKSI